MKWSQAKKELQVLEKSEMLKLFKNLFALNSENKTVFESMLGARDCVSLDYYKKEISSAVNPKWETPINLSRGHKAIAQFKKGAPDDHVSRLDLMMHFVEQTAAQTLECMHQDRR